MRRFRSLVSIDTKKAGQIKGYVTIDTNKGGIGICFSAVCLCRTIDTKYWDGTNPRVTAPTSTWYNRNLTTPTMVG